ncbi:hypothetical protein MKW94_011376, partial [Papaver nudicaule]|nr:hypothetical protein [Papaver nudicaule]
KFRATSVPKEIREKCMNRRKCYAANFSGLTEVGGKIALSQQWDLAVVKLWICGDDASISSYSSWTEMTLELPFQWDNSISAFFHGVAGADQIIIESNPSGCRANIKAAALYSYDLEKKMSTGKVKSGVVSKLVSGSLFSNLESVSLFSSFAEIRLNVDVTAAPDSALAPVPIESFPDMCLRESIMKDLSFHGYARPSSIQAQAMPVALSGRDFLRHLCLSRRSVQIEALAQDFLTDPVQVKVGKASSPTANVSNAAVPESEKRKRMQPQPNRGMKQT